MRAVTPRVDRRPPVFRGGGGAVPCAEGTLAHTRERARVRESDRERARASESERESESESERKRESGSESEREREI